MRIKLILLLVPLALANPDQPPTPRYRADRFPSLAATVAGAAAHAEVFLPDGYTAALDSQLLLSGEGTTIRCAPGARIVKRFSGDAIHITGRNITIDGCRIEGFAGTGGLILLNDARGVLIRNCTLTGSAGVAVAIYTSADVIISGSTFVRNHGSPIFAQDGLERIEIASNTIDSSGVPLQKGIDTVGVHTWMPGGTAVHIDIHDNTIVHAGDNFAIEVGAFSAESKPPVDVLVRHNTIRLAADSNGAVSYSTLNHGSISGNRIDAGGHAIHIDAIELVSTTGVIAAGNRLTNTPPATTYTIAINGGSTNAVENNTFEGGIYVGTSRRESPGVDSNMIQGNTLTAPRDAAFPRGLIWFQCNTFNCSVSRNVVRNNVLKGNNSGVAVFFENDYWDKGGRMDSNESRGNEISGSTARVNVGPHVTNTVL